MINVTVFKIEKFNKQRLKIYSYCLYITPYHILNHTSIKLWCYRMKLKL